MSFNSMPLALIADEAYRRQCAICHSQKHRLAHFLHCKPLSNGPDSGRLHVCHVDGLFSILRQLSDEYNSISLDSPNLEPFLIMKHRLLWTFSCQCGRLRRTFLFHA